MALLMKATLKTGLFKVKASCLIRTNLYIRDNFIKEFLMARVHLQELMEVDMKVNGKMRCLMEWELKALMIIPAIPECLFLA